MNHKLIPQYQRIHKKFTNHVEHNLCKSGFLPFSPMSGISLFEQEKRASVTAMASNRAGETKGKSYQICLQEMWEALGGVMQADYNVRAGKLPTSIST
jgi:hypothetical protein